MSLGSFTISGDIISVAEREQLALIMSKFVGEAMEWPLEEMLAIDESNEIPSFSTEPYKPLPGDEYFVGLPFEGLYEDTSFNELIFKFKNELSSLLNVTPIPLPFDAFTWRVFPEIEKRKSDNNDETTYRMYVRLVLWWKAEAVKLNGYRLPSTSNWIGRWKKGGVFT